MDASQHGKQTRKTMLPRENMAGKHCSPSPRGSEGVKFPNQITPDFFNQWVPKDAKKSGWTFQIGSFHSGGTVNLKNIRFSQTLIQFLISMIKLLKYDAYSFNCLYIVAFFTLIPMVYADSDFETFLLVKSTVKYQKSKKNMRIFFYYL